MSSQTTNLIGLGMSPALAVQLGNPLVKVVTANTTIDTSYDGVVIYCTNAGTITLTFPNLLTVTTFNCAVVQGGAGTVTCAAGTGATMNNRQSFTGTAGQYAIVGILAIASTKFILSGDAA
jgi:hypothetical protein